MARVPDSLITLGLALLGLVLMVTPLALWVAWTESILIAVLATGIAAGVLYGVLVRFEKPDGPARSEPADRVPLERPPDKMFEEFNGLHPFIHHNGPVGSSKFRAIMSHLKRHLYGKPD